MIWIIPLFLLIVFEGIADILSKEWSLHGNWFWWVGAISAYVIANAFWLFALRQGSGLARGGMIFFIASAILALLIGVFLYREEIAMHQYIGMGFGVVALVFIFW